ncbi:MAG: 2-C-methyl-D-erythritol 4-phosphate cytidylyltransferase, partial [Intrasporangiaceae bacterium]|nr:2-C-methyl-D-erythritol 4-phosphate cytidylyltransferase [Intrasporangiaceae bacterium]
MVQGDGRSVGVVCVAAGDGTRLRAGTPKALIEVDGLPLVVHAVRSLAAAGLPPPVVVHPPDDGPAVARALADEPFATLVAGGSTRTDSVRRGVAALPAGGDLVAIHDAARPLVPVAVVHRVLAAMRDGVQAAAPGLPVSDTLKRVADGSVLTTVDREGLVGVQTPQIFPREVLD